MGSFQVDYNGLDSQSGAMKSTSSRLSQQASSISSIASSIRSNPSLENKGYVTKLNQLKDKVDTYATEVNRYSVMLTDVEAQYRKSEKAVRDALRENVTAENGFSAASRFAATGVGGFAGAGIGAGFSPIPGYRFGFDPKIFGIPIPRLGDFISTDPKNWIEWLKGTGIDLGDLTKKGIFAIGGGAAAAGGFLLSAFLDGKSGDGALYTIGEGAVTLSKGPIPYLDTTAEGSAKLGSWNWEIKGYGEGKAKQGYNDDSMGKPTVGIGVEAEGEFTGIDLHGKVHSGLTDVEGNLKVGDVAVKGDIGATLWKDGKFAPALKAEVEASASAAKGDVSMRSGIESAGITVGANGDVLTAKANAGVGAGKITFKDESGNVKTGYGVKAEAGAEAYLAQGRVSQTFDIFGIKISAGVSGKAGGAGASAGGYATSNGVGGKVDLGLGVGLGVDVGVDWSGFSLEGAAKSIQKDFNNAKQFMSDVGTGIVQGTGDFIEWAGNGVKNLFSW